MAADRRKRTYKVLVAGYYLGDYYAAGATIELLPEQAEYDTPPHGNGLALVTPRQTAAG